MAKSKKSTKPKDEIPEQQAPLPNPNAMVRVPLDGLAPHQQQAIQPAIQEAVRHLEQASMCLKFAFGDRARLGVDLHALVPQNVVRRPEPEEEEPGE